MRSGFEGGISQSCKRRPPAFSPSTFAELSRPWKRFVQMCEEVCYGTIIDLRVRDGEPFFEPPPRTIKKYKTHRVDDVRPEASRGNFRLKEQHFGALRALSPHKNAVAKVMVCNGVPAELSVEDTPMA